jgi:hypothetical protein
MSNGIDFVIGGKDQAKPAMTAVEKSLERLEQKTEAVGKSTRRLAAITSALTAAYATIKSALAIVGGIDKMNAAFDAQTESLRRLNASFQIRGASASASAQMQDAAKAIEKLTGVSDNATLTLMQQAAGMGFATDRMDDAAKAAIGLSHAMGKDAAASMADMKAALEGNFAAFHQVNPQILLMRTHQEKLAAVMVIANQGLKAQSEDMGTVSGSGRRADSAMANLMETFGKILAPIRVLINAGLQTLSESLSKVLAPAAAYATSVLENIGPMMDWIKEKVIQGVNLMIGAFTVFEVILMNLGDVWELVVSSVRLYVIQIVESVKHAFTTTMPAYIKWFGENFINLIVDAFNGVLTIVQNAGRKLGEMVYQIFAFIASGGEGGISGLMRELGQAASGSLLEGFESSLTSLPDIAERQLTQREKDLADKIGAIGGRLGKEFSDKMKERMLGVGSDLTDEMNAAAKGIDLKARASVMTQGINVTEGRVLTRGPGSSMPNKLDEIIRLLKNPPKKENKILVQIDPQQMRVWDDIEMNTSKTLQMEAIA